MWKHNQEAIDAVETFNGRVMETIGEDRDFSGDHLMTMATDATTTSINFMGVSLWSSEEDEREFSEAKNEYEPLLGFLERRAKEELERFSRILLPKTEEEV